MIRCDDINKCCINCANAKIEFWDRRNNYNCAFDCPYYRKDTSMIIGFLKMHTCEHFKKVESEET